MTRLRDRARPLPAALLGLLLAWAAAGPAAAQTPTQRVLIDQPNHPCGSLAKEPGGYGPFDYRTQRDRVGVVEAYHFTPKVEALAGGQSATIGGDLDYTLRAFPNHHRALVALARWAERSRSDRTDGMNWSVECYYDRALRFAPDDAITRALYAQFLHKRKRGDEALAQLDTAARQSAENGLTLHNLGLVYLDLGAFDRALAMAHQAAALGLPEARNAVKAALVKAGRWREPSAAAAADGASRPAASPAPGAAAAPAAAASAAAAKAP